MTIIRLRDMEFYARVGHSREERSVGGRIIVDVEMELSLPDEPLDSLKGTIDYAAVHARVGEVVGAREHVLLEDVAVRILDALGDVGASRVRVTVRKPQPPVDGIVGCAEVERERTL